MEKFFQKKTKTKNKWDFPEWQPLTIHIFEVVVVLKKYKRNVDSSTKRIVGASQKWRCKRCKNLLSACFEVDHIIPLHKGGSNKIRNLAAKCKECHGMKTIFESASFINNSHSLVNF